MKKCPACNKPYRAGNRAILASTGKTATVCPACATSAIRIACPKIATTTTTRTEPTIAAAHVHTLLRRWEARVKQAKRETVSVVFGEESGRLEMLERCADELRRTVEQALGR